MASEQTDDVAWAGYGQDQASMEHWVRDRFSDEAFESLDERSIRLVEETIELHQAESAHDPVITRERLHKLVDAVMDKKAGEPAQELGGVSTCLLAYCAAKDIRLDVVTDAEIKRIFKISRQHFDKRAEEKRGLGIGL